MSSSNKWSAPWVRIIAEGFVIVISILLAFGIDAWWDGRREEARREALVESIRSDFETTQARLAQTIEVGDEVIARIRGFLALPNTEEMPPLDSVRYLVNGAFTAIEIQSALANFEGALGSGEIGLIQSEQFLEATADFRQAHSWTKDHGLIAADQFYHGVTMRLRDQVGSIGALIYDREACPENRPILCPYPEEFELTAEQIVDLLSRREIYSGFETVGNVQRNFVRGLRDMDAAAGRVLAALDEVD